MNALNFDHAHHTLKIRGLSSPPDVLSFEGREHLSQPFCYDIQFTSRDKTLEPEAVLMQDGALSLCAPPVQGCRYRCRCAPCMASSPALNSFPPRAMKHAMKCASNPAGAARPQPSERHLPEPERAADCRENPA
jgi:hypothetical protein